MGPYKGYTASITYEDGDDAIHGTVDGITDVVHFCGRTPEELTAAFRDSVNAYLQGCAEDGVEPQRPPTES